MDIKTNKKTIIIFFAFLTALLTSLSANAYDSDYTNATAGQTNATITLGDATDLNDGLWSAVDSFDADKDVYSHENNGLVEGGTFYLTFANNFSFDKVGLRNLFDASSNVYPFKYRVYITKSGVSKTIVGTGTYDGNNGIDTNHSFAATEGDIVGIEFYDFSADRIIVLGELQAWGDEIPPPVTEHTTSPSPVYTNTDFNFNMTATDTDNATFTGYVQFYINGTASGAEQSQTMNNNTNTLIGTLSSSNFGTGAELIAEYWVGDGESNTSRTNTTTAYVDDTIAPTISPDNLADNSTIVYLNSNITGQINATDIFLYSLNVSIDDVSIFNTSGITMETYVYNLSHNASSYGTGEHNISVRVCDGHTNTKLMDKWEQNIGMTGLTFKEDKKWFKINPANSDWFEKITTQKKTDRYTFTYEKSLMGDFLTREDTYSFVVESTDYIDIITREDSPYKAWLVIPSIGTTGRWIDFNLKGAPKAEYKVRRLSSNRVEVTISNVPSDIKTLEFESTGELNCDTEYYSFYVYNYSTSYTTPVLETSSQNFTLNITRDTDYLNNANATLHWNGTAYNSTKTTTDDYFYFIKELTIPSVGNNTNITLNWTYTLEGNSENKTNRTSDEVQLIYNIAMDDCTTYTIQALNFSLREESNDNLTNGDMDFTFSLAQEGTTINYSKAVSGVDTTAFCIPNNEINFTAQLQSEYDATGYNPHTYFAYDLRIDNSTQYIDYYLTNGTTLVTFTVIDQSGDGLEDSYIKIKKYDIGTGTYKTIETLKTDSQGEAIGNIVLNTVWYEFVVEYEGDVLLEDGPTKISTTSRTFRVNLLTDFYEQYTDVMTGIIHSLTYTDSTGNFRFTWSDPDGNYHYGCLKVVKRGLSGDTLLNETCVASTAGTILVNVNSTGTVNGTYIATGYVMFDEVYVLDVLAKTWGTLSDVFGKEGLWYSFLLILTLVAVGIFAPKLAVALAVVGIVFSSILGFFNLNIGWVVGLIIAAGLTIYRMRDY